MSFKRFADELLEGAEKYRDEKLSRDIKNCPFDGCFCNEESCTWFINGKCAVVIIAERLTNGNVSR
jgi:hypothetical protein